MPFPEEAFSYRGGCNCRAIRYRVTVPPHASRPGNPYDHPTPRSKLPMAAICHCNDCRRSHAQPIGFALINVLEWVEFSLAPSSSSSETFTAAEVGKMAATTAARDEADLRLTSQASDRPWIAATTFLDNAMGPIDAKLSGTWLRFYRSSTGRARGFCTRCGTPLCYFVFGSMEELPEGWIPQLDLWMGAVDRCDLERDWFVPDRELWMNFGLEWAGVITGQGHAEGMERARFGTFK